MAAGINHFLFISALIMGLGIYLLISYKNYFRLLAGLVLIFTAPVLNIAAFEGFSNNYTEGYILIILTGAVCFSIIAAGGLIYYRIIKEKDITSE